MPNYTFIILLIGVIVFAIALRLIIIYHNRQKYKKTDGKYGCHGGCWR